MIRQHYEDELAELNRAIMKMGLKVEEAIDSSVDSLKNKDVELAQRIIDDDDIIDTMEKDLCDQCALIIAREQPVAGDLRHLISGIKIITDLERIADHAVHIAKGTIKMAGEDYIKPLIDIPPYGSAQLQHALPGGQRLCGAGCGICDRDCQRGHTAG